MRLNSSYRWPTRGECRTALASYSGVLRLPLPSAATAAASASSTAPKTGLRDATPAAAKEARVHGLAATATAAAATPTPNQTGVHHETLHVVVLLAKTGHPGRPDGGTAA